MLLTARPPATPALSATGLVPSSSESDTTESTSTMSEREHTPRTLRPRTPTIACHVNWYGMDT